MSINKIVILKDALMIGEDRIAPPFKKEKIDAILGCPQKYQNETMQASNIYVWNDLGMGCYYNEVSDEYDDLFLTVEDNEYKYTNTVFQGELLVDKKSYLDCSWKETMTNYYETKYGCFEFVRFLGKQLPIKVDIYYRKPRSNKYKLKKIKEQEIVFDNFNFKLAVIQKLMYEKELLLPKFDIYEFCDEYEKRDIDPIEEGYDKPIKEVMDWFKKYQIPLSLADEVDEICMDGGDDIYLQIMPNWDGEDDFYDINQISIEEVSQFKNLKKLTLMSTNIEEIREKLKTLNIDIEQY